MNLRAPVHLKLSAVLIAALLFSASCSGVAKQETGSAEALKKKAEAAYQAKHYQQAWTDFHKAVEAETRSSGSQSERLAWLLQVWALRYSDTGNYRKATPLFKSSLSIYEKHDRTWQYKLALLRSIRNYIRADQYENAVPQLEKAVRYFEHEKGWLEEGSKNNTEYMDWSFIADCLNDCGEVLLRKGQAARAKPLLTQSLKIRDFLSGLKEEEQINDRPGIDTANTLICLARVNIAAGRKAEASGLLERASKLMAGTVPDWHCQAMELADLKARLASSAGDRNPLLKCYSRDSFDDRSLWSLYLKAGERINRLKIQGWWWTENGRCSFDHALKLSESFPEGDNRLPLTLAQSAEYHINSLNNSKEGSQLAARSLSLIAADSNCKLANEIKRTIYAALAKQPSALIRLMRKQIVKTSTDSKKTELKSALRDYIRAVASSGYTERARAAEYTPLLTKFEEVLGPTNEALEGVYPAVAYEYELNGKYFDAMICYRKLVKLKKQKYGPQAEETGKTLLKYADLLLSTNDIQGAAAARKEAEGILGR